MIKMVIKDGNLGQKKVRYMGHKIGRIVKTSRGYGILAEFPVGDSDVYVQKMLVTNTSKKKAEKLLKDWLEVK
jgi:hypothetical protein